METVVCNLCGSDQQVTLFTAHDLRYKTPGRFSVTRCLRCHLVFVSPRPTVLEIEKHYPSITREHLSVAAPNLFALEQAKKVIARHSEQGTILDVGCAAGYFLSAMQERGWKVYGVEPDDAASKTALTVPGSIVKQGILEASDFSELKFDAITFWSSLEHLHDPSATLEIVRQRLKPEGFLYLGVPNFDSLERRLFRAKWFHLDVPRHLYHFTTATLKAMLERVGLEIVEVKHASGHEGVVSSLKMTLGLKLNEAPTSTGINESTETEQHSLHATQSLPSRFKGFVTSSVVNMADRLGQGSQILIVARPSRT